MQRRLLGITHVGGVLALGFGLATLTALSQASSAYLQQGWLHAKLALVLLLVAYHLMLVRLVRQFARDEIRHSSRWLRIFNEIPALLLIAIVLLVVLKPSAAAPDAGAGDLLYSRRRYRGHRHAG